MFALRELPQIYFSFSGASHRWPVFPHNLRLRRCGQKAENVEAQWGFRSWSAGTHSTDSVIYSEKLSAQPRSHSKLLSEPPWTAPPPPVIHHSKVLAGSLLCLCPPHPRPAPTPTPGQPGSRLALVLQVWGLPCLFCAPGCSVAAFTAEPTYNILKSPPPPHLGEASISSSSKR